MVSELPRVLLQHQSGVFAVSQAEQAGVGQKSVRWMASSGRWQRLLPRVYVAHNGPVTHQQRVWAAVLYAGEGAFVSHDSALHLIDRQAQSPPVVHLSIPATRVVTAQPGIRIHRTRTCQGVLFGTAPPRAGAERATLEAASLASTSDQAVAIVAAAVQKGLTTAHRLGLALEVVPRLRRRSTIREALELAGAGAHSLLEVTFERIRRSHRLPEPDRQKRLGPARVDVDLAGLLVELDGRLGHFDVDGWTTDMIRDDLHTIAGAATLRFNSILLLTKPALVAHITAAACLFRGWSGEPRCPTGCAGFAPADAVINAVLRQRHLP
jgi:hypothetical protein